jgi:hypothetical protein
VADSSSFISGADGVSVKEPLPVTIQVSEASA